MDSEHSADKAGTSLNVRRIGYARVSPVDPNSEGQLEQVAFDAVFIDIASSDAPRPQREALLDSVREGDTVVVRSMDRLARDSDELRSLVQHLIERGVRVEFVDENVAFTGKDTSTAFMFLFMKGVLFAFEQAVARERQLEKRNQRAVYSRLRRLLSPKQAAELRRRVAAGELKADLAREIGISRETLYKYLRRTSEDRR